MARVLHVVDNGRRADFDLPPDHKFGMRVPRGGSNCAKCTYIGQDRKSCTNTYFQNWRDKEGARDPAALPAPAAELLLRRVRNGLGGKGAPPPPPRGDPVSLERKNGPSVLLAEAMLRSLAHDDSSPRPEFVRSVGVGVGKVRFCGA